MSLSVFIDDLCTEPLDRARLQKVWEHHNLVSKSYLIDPIMRLVLTVIEKKGTLSPEQTRKVCDQIRTNIIRKKVSTVEPQLETQTVGGKDVQADVATGIVFEEREGKKVAVGVKVGPKVYDLQLKHLSICMSKGWYHLKAEGFSSPFEV